MFEQQLYTRTNQHGLVNITQGHDTVAASKGLSVQSLRTLNKDCKYLFEKSKVGKIYPKIRYVFRNSQDQFVIGQSVSGNDGTRGNYLCHNYVITENELTTMEYSKDIKTLANPELHFIEEFDDSSDNKVLDTITSLNTEKSSYYVAIEPFISQHQVSIESLNQIVNLILKNLITNSKEKQFIYISLPVLDEDLSCVAVDFMARVLALIPYRLRPKIGYNTFYLGGQEELSSSNIQVYFVPDGELNKNKRLGSKPLENHSIFNFTTNYFRNTDIEENEFSSFLIRHYSNEAVLLHYYDVVDSLLKNANIDLEEYLSQLNLVCQLVEYLDIDSPDFTGIWNEDIAPLISWLLNLENNDSNQTTSSYIKKLVDYYYKMAKESKDPVSIAYLTSIINVPWLREQSLETIQIGLHNASQDHDKIIELIELTKDDNLLNQELVDRYIVKDKQSSIVFIQKQFERASNVEDVLSILTELVNRYPDFIKSKVAYTGLSEMVVKKISFLSITDLTETLEIKVSTSPKIVVKIYNLIAYQLFEKVRLTDYTVFEIKTIHYQPPVTDKISVFFSTIKILQTILEPQFNYRNEITETLENVDSKLKDLTSRVREMVKEQAFNYMQNLILNTNYVEMQEKIFFPRVLLTNQMEPGNEDVDSLLEFISGNVPEYYPFFILDLITHEIEEGWSSSGNITEIRKLLSHLIDYYGGNYSILGSENNDKHMQEVINKLTTVHYFLEVSKKQFKGQLKSIQVANMPSGIKKTFVKLIDKDYKEHNKKDNIIKENRSRKNRRSDRDRKNKRDKG